MKLHQVAIAIVFLLTFASCVPRAVPVVAPQAWAGTPNPLDEPGGGGLPSAAQLHRENIRAITSNPCYGIQEEMAESWVPPTPE